MGLKVCVALLLDPDKLAKASLNNVAYALTQVHTARRLEEGKATSNVNVLSKIITQAHEQLFPTPQPVGKSGKDNIVVPTGERVD